MIKTAIIGDSDLFDDLLRIITARLWKGIRPAYISLVDRSVKFKAAVVSEDEKETGIRDGF